MPDALAPPPALLFVSEANAGRSRLAEALACALLPGRRIYSVGARPQALHPMVARVLKLRGIPLIEHPSHRLNDVPLREVDVAVHFDANPATLDRLAAALAPAAQRIHWPLPDPATGGGTDAAQLKRFVSARDELERRIRFELMAHPGLTAQAMVEPHGAAQ